MKITQGSRQKELPEDKIVWFQTLDWLVQKTRSQFWLLKLKNYSTKAISKFLTSPSTSNSISGNSVHIAFTRKRTTFAGSLPTFSSGFWQNTIWKMNLKTLMTTKVIITVKISTKKAKLTAKLKVTKTLLISKTYNMSSVKPMKF